MKTNRLKHIILGIVLLFSFKIDVYAAQELTCVYNTGFNGSGVWDSTSSMILIQTSTGDIEIWKNSSTGADIDDQGWKQSSAKYNLSDSSLKDYKDEDGYLIKCPQSEARPNGNPVFYGDSQGKRMLTENKSLTVVKRPHIYETDSSQSQTYSGKTCSSISDDSKWINSTTSEGAHCLYQDDVSAGCHVIQLDITKEGDFKVSQDDPGFVGGTKPDKISIKQDEKKLNIDSLNSDYVGYCPVSIYVKRDEVISPETYTFEINSYVTMSKKSGYKEYIRIGQKGENLVTGETISDDVKIPLNFEKVKITSCEQLLGGEDGDTKLRDMLATLISIIRILVPIILLVLGSLDFAQAIFAGDEEKMRKAQKKFMKRLIIGIVIFLIPSVLKVILTIANSIWGNIDTDLCGLI